MQTLDDFGWPLETVQQMLFLRTHAYFLHYKGDNELEPSSRAPTKLYPRPIFTSNTTHESIRFELSELPTVPWSLPVPDLLALYRISADFIFVS